MLEERKHAAVFVEDFIQREQEVDAGLAQVKELRKHWEDKVVEANREVEKIRREMIAPRKITFATPTEQQPLATPKDNMTKAAELLKKRDEEIDINYLRTLVASAVQQQSKADTSRRLESNPEHCVSTAQKDARENRHRDDESRTGSSERRRKTREHPNPIPVPSKTPPSDPRKGKDPMYSGRDKYRNPSPPPNGYPRPPRRRSPAGNTRPQGHGGIVIRDNVLPSGNRNRERTPEPRRNQNNDHEPEPRRSRNEERDPEPRRSRNDQGSQRHGEGSHRSRSQHRGESGGGSKRSDRPPRRNECENVDHTTAMYAFIVITLPPMTTQAVISQLQQSPYTNKRKTAITVTTAATNAKILMTRRAADPTWSPWRSNAEAQEAEEDAAAEAEPAGSAAWHRGHRAGSRAPQTYEEYRDMPCLAHLDPATGKSTHTNRNCKWVNDLKNDPEAGYKRARKHRPRGKGGKGKNKDKEEDSSEAMDEDDNSPDPKAGSADGYDFSKCLMDGGASLNIMYLETLERMNLTKEQLKHSNTEFHGVVPGKKANSLGSITLPVAFGDVHNFREEKITFEVVPFKSSYHVIFGRPTYHKFHARACYIYNKLKMPGPNGMITITGDYKKAHECELGEAAFAESVISGEELKGYRAAVDPTEMQTTKKQISEQKTSFKPAIETKKHDLIPGATYQRTMQRCLKDQIGRNVHAYVDDIAVMTRKGSDLISDLTETFDNLRRYKMMLNPLKCVFGVPAGKLLGFIVSHRGIEVNPEKIKAILCIKRPTCLKDVQRLTGCVAAISRFVSRLGEKALPLYKLLKKTDKFVWDDAADAALRGLKEILTSPPILAAPAESEPMLLYLAATNKVISLVIVVERKEEGHEYDVQRPVYYISEVLTESKQRYPHFQKLAYGVFLGSRKLRHYFQEHPVTVVSKAPLSTILNNADATGRTAKWGIELSPFDIAYKPRIAVKSQVLADFVADWTEAPDASLEPEPETWVMHFDGSKQHQGSGAGVTLKSPTGEELQYVLQIHFEATNNMAEYEALLHWTSLGNRDQAHHLLRRFDLVAQQ
ncbi:hypothetical protein QYE76_001860 [Lolium multiflorum]|uniref:Uncharacterized protein n=1 Tax=Lolium multiflorum TaxID=4521 RepID=A0AAD8RLG7_LOLMU|nr:hypothetical protein QYE76_001860 [Lolium multiflorum]